MQALWQGIQPDDPFVMVVHGDMRSTSLRVFRCALIVVALLLGGVGAAQQPIVVTSSCLGVIASPHHSLAMGAASFSWFGPAIKAVPRADGGSVVIARYTAGPDTGVQVTRFDGSGSAVWNYSFTDVGVPFLEPTTICLANDSGYLISGQTAGYTDHWDPFLLKLDADGNSVWFKTYSCDRSLYVNDVSQGPSGAICMVGADYFLYTAFWPSPWNTAFVPTENAAAVFVTDGAGDPVSFKPYSFHFNGVDRKWEHFEDVEPLSGGGFLIAGNSGHNWDLFASTILRIDDGGNQVWCRNWLCTQFGGFWNSDAAQCAVQLSPTTALIGGYVSDHDQYGTGWSYHDAFASAIDLATGDPIWSKRYASTAASVTDGVLSNGRFLITGAKYSSNSGTVGGMLYDVNAATGAIDQLRTYHYDAGPGAAFASIDAYANGDLLLAGSTSRNGFRQATVQRMDGQGSDACTDSLWADPAAIDLVWTEQMMSINDPGGQNPSPATTIPTTAVDRSLQRACVCARTGTFCPLVPDTLFVLAKDTLACTGDPLYIDPHAHSASQCGQPAFAYVWTYYANGAVVNDAVIGGTLFGTYTGTDPVPVVAPAGSTSMQVRLSVLDCSGDTLCRVARSVGISAGQLANTVLGPDTVFCGTSLVLGPGSTDSTATFTWYASPLGGGLQQAQDSGAISTNAYYTASATGTYFLLTDLHGCESLDSILVDMDRLHLDLLDSAHFCAHDSVVLNATWPGATAYTWSGIATDTTATALVSTAGEAIVRIHVANCVGTDTISVVEQPLPELDLPDSVPLCIDTRVAHLLIIDAHDSGLWSTGSISSSIDVAAEGYYGARIRNNGCWSNADSSLVYLDDCSCALYLPNSFTPDGDGINDAWAPVMDCDLRTMDLLLFNRWGEIIAELTSRNQTWDGTYGGQKCPIGVYPYKLRYTSGRVDTATIAHAERYGHVSLVR